MRTIRIFSFLLLLAICLKCGNNFLTIEPRQSDFIPSDDVKYKLIGEYLYKPGANTWPGPSWAFLSGAWKLANEFVYRTHLRTEYLLPAGASFYDKESKLCYIVFNSTDNKRTLIIAVDGKGCVWISGDKTKAREWRKGTA